MSTCPAIDLHPIQGLFLIVAFVSCYRYKSYYNLVYDKQYGGWMNELSRGLSPYLLALSVAQTGYVLCSFHIISSRALGNWILLVFVLILSQKAASAKSRSLFYRDPSETCDIWPYGRNHCLFKPCKCPTKFYTEFQPLLYCLLYPSRLQTCTHFFSIVTYDCCTVLHDQTSPFF